MIQLALSLPGLEEMRYTETDTVVCHTLCIEAVATGFFFNA